MRKFPAPIHRAVSALSALPGVGPKTALRYTFALLRMSNHQRQQIAKAIVDLANINQCKQCFAHSEESLCAICSDESRDNSLLCIVAESRDIATMEATNAYSGYYFVLGGTLNPVEGQTPEQLNMRALQTHIQAHPEIQEIILAFSPDVHGESTMMYLSRQFRNNTRRITRLARGLPLGADLEYADEVTLGEALTGRRDA